MLFEGGPVIEKLTDGLRTYMYHQNLAQIEPEVLRLSTSHYSSTFEHLAWYVYLAFEHLAFEHLAVVRMRSRGQMV